MGRFGPFVQAGTKDDVEKPKFAGLRKGQKMDTITLADALVLFQHLEDGIVLAVDGQETASACLDRFHEKGASGRS